MWRDVRRVLSAEWLKARGSRGLYAGPVVYVVVLVLLYVAYNVAARQGLIGIETGFFVAGSVLSAATTPLAFVALLLTAFGISREFSQRTIQNVWTRPINRSGWLLGKAISAGMMIGSYFLLTVVVVLVLAGGQFGYAPLAEKDYIIHTSGALWGNLLLCAFLTLAAMLTVVIVAGIPAILVNNAGGALALMLTAGFLMQIADGWDALRPFLITTYIGQPFEQFVAMAKGIPVPWEWGALVRTCVIGTVAWSVGGILGSMALVRRKEILG
jgi:ABC-type transport system involved in multi-copper enzyme maturation permease subunit